MPGLSVSDVVKVSINLAPLAVPVRNFGAVCIAGPSTVIDTKERLRLYTSIDGIAADFGSSAPEYLAGLAFFSQAPRPAFCYVGRFAQTAASAVLHGGRMTAAQQASLLATLANVTDGTFKISIDGTPRTVAASPAILRSPPFAGTAQTSLVTVLQGITGGGFKITVDGTAYDTGALDFSTIADLDDAATLVDTALEPNGASFEWDAELAQFIVKSLSTGIASSLSYASAPATGTDLSDDFKLTAATGAMAPTSGSDGMDFSGVTNLNGAASILSNALVGARAWFDGVRFHVESTSGGPTSTLSYASASGAGQDVSAALRLTSGIAAAPINGIAAETPLQAAVALRAHPEWYGLMFAASITDSDHVSIASFIEAADPISIYGYTTEDATVLDATSTTDIAATIQSLEVERTFGQFSSSNPYACAAIFGRAFTVDFQANSSVITLKFKQEPIIIPEQLTENEAQTLRAKNCNVFVYYSNDAAIIQEGVMANGYFFDEVHGMDWLSNQVQTDLFDVLYQATTKIPQTNAGVHILLTSVVNSINLGVTNGLIAPGQWNAPGFGQLKTGQMLPLGYYVYAPTVETQPQSIREQRIAPTIQAAVKLAGAVHFVNCQINVNR
jgi:hypothetical protein